ncbi:TPA: lysoplasmalogenase [Stenotrophomonas maltophilia]|nr:lysoplasmalogenase [Stenotrophomonas maltophilia]
MKLRARDGLILLMAILAIIGAFLHGDGRWLHWLAKPVTTLLIAAIAWRVRDPAQPFYRRAVLAGMLLSCVGDIALMLPMDAFVPGLVAFLLAHLCYIVAFRDGLRAGRGLLAAGVLLGAFAVLNVLGLWPHLPAPMRIPVLAYVVVLASMAVLALARQWRRPRPGAAEASSARWAAAGALLFVASDSLLAWDRFSGGLPLASLLVLSTYYGAQYAIARSVKQQKGDGGN